MVVELLVCCVYWMYWMWSDSVIEVLLRFILWKIVWIFWRFNIRRTDQDMVYCVYIICVQGESYRIVQELCVYIRIKVGYPSTDGGRSFL